MAPARMASIIKWKCQFVSYLSKPILIGSTPTQNCLRFFIKCVQHRALHTHTHARCAHVRVFKCQRIGQLVWISTPDPMSNFHRILNALLAHRYIRRLPNVASESINMDKHWTCLSTLVQFRTVAQIVCTVWKVQFNTDNMIEVCNLQCLCI